MSETPETDARTYVPSLGASTVPAEIARKLERERDKARTELEMWLDGNIMHQIHRDELEKAERERDEALKELSSIHQWIDRNHADGFIDSLTYFQNLERVTDNWYDRLDRLEVDAKRFVRERNEARELHGNALREREATEKEVDAMLERAQKAERERDEAQAKLTNIYRWIERNHSDGFIDSLSYSQNLERVTDNWYDRLDRLEVDAKRFVRERNEAREDAAQLADRLSGLELRTTEELARLKRELDSARHEAGFWHKLYKQFSIYEEETK